MKEQRIKANQASNRTRRVRAKLHGTKIMPRLTVKISNRHIHAQLIDDDSSKTLGAFSTLTLKTKAPMTDQAKQVGVEIAKLAQSLKIKRAVLDRGPKKYHGRIKALADSAREEGLQI